MIKQACLEAESWAQIRNNPFFGRVSHRKTAFAFQIVEPKSSSDVEMKDLVWFLVPPSLQPRNKRPIQRRAACLLSAASQTRLKHMHVSRKKKTNTGFVLSALRWELLGLRLGCVSSLSDSTMFSSGFRSVSSCLQTDPPVRRAVASLTDCCRTFGTRPLLSTSRSPDILTHLCLHYHPLPLPPVSSEDSLFFLPVSPSSVSNSCSGQRRMLRGQACVSEQR